MQVTIDGTTAALWEYQGKKGIIDSDGDLATWSRADIEKIVGRVNKGATLLDEKKPEWRQEVAPDSLDMGHGGRCIIGQAYGDYTKFVGVPFGMGVFSGSQADQPKVIDKATEHGFLVHDEEIPYELLDRVWVYLLEERANRGQDGLTLELPAREPLNRQYQRLFDASLLNEDEV